MPRRVPPSWRRRVRTKAILKTAIDTTWANHVELVVETELDDPHDLNTGELADVMVYSMERLLKAVYAQGERAEDTDRGQPWHREFRRYEEMALAHEAGDRQRQDEGVLVAARSCPIHDELLTYRREGNRAFFMCDVEGCDHREEVSNS